MPKILTDLPMAHSYMFLRYIDILRASSLEDKARWISFCEKGRTLDNVDKQSRWVGFIQGLLYANKLVTIEDERIFSRAIYKPIYEDLGMNSVTQDVL